jgi:hypothetical protein
MLALAWSFLSRSMNAEAEVLVRSFKVYT